MAAVSALLRPVRGTGIFTIALDDAVNAANDPDIAFFVEAAKVTGSVPDDIFVVADFRSLEGFGIVVIGAADMLAGNQQLADAAM